MASYRNLLFLQDGCLAAGLLCTLAGYASARDIQVFTDRYHPVDSIATAQVVEVDAPISLEAELSTRLPANPSLAAAIVRGRLDTGGAALQRKLSVAYQGVVYAWSLGIKKIPAVVVGRRYVVYGVSDVAHAVSIIDRYRRSHP
jgi:integrating conjugative element protein (TIGR03757 family)